MRNALQLLERRHVFARVSADAAGGWTAMNSGVTLEVVGRPQVGRKNANPPHPHAARHLHSYLHINTFPSLLRHLLLRVNCRLIDEPLIVGIKSV